MAEQNREVEELHGNLEEHVDSISETLDIEPIE